MSRKGTILMSEREREALVVMERVKRREITMAEATRQLGISYRQCWRRYRRYEEEGPRGRKCCLMVMIDDATGIRMSLFAEEETTEAAMKLLRMWIERYGVPRSLYTDKKNVYVACEKDQENARLEGREALPQFGRACRKLGITIIRAHSPQAKGRVERSNGVYQDRLVKEASAQRHKRHRRGKRVACERVRRQSEPTLRHPAE